MKTGNQRYLYLIISAIMMLFAGVLYAWSILKTPYLREFNWTQSELGLNFTILMSCFCLGGILGGAIIKKLPLWLIINSAAILACIGFWVAGSVQKEAIWALYLSYGMLCGLGIGLAYNVIISTIINWFPDKRATISGVLMMCFGSSSLVFGFISNAIMNSLGWRMMFRALGLSILIIFVLCSFILRARSEPQNEYSEQNEKSMTSKEMLCSFSFWRFYIYLILIGSIGACIISLCKDISLFIGAGETIAIVLTGILSVCNGFGRILSGILTDKIGSFKTIRITSLVAVSATVLMLMAVITRQLWVLFPAVMLIGASYGFIPPLQSGFLSTMYGKKHFPLNFSLATTMLFFASFSATLGGWIYGLSGGYTALIIMLCIFAVMGTGIGATIKIKN
jgi:OFA family oxalate/formate antiporter-like MFS transporter